MHLVFLLLLLLSYPFILEGSYIEVKSPTCNFPAIFNFGDSNSDTGGLSAAFTPKPPPYGETFFGMPAGRCSDGRLTIDFIAESLRLPYLNPYLNSVGANFSHGANFATAGSEILPPFTRGYSPFTLGVQLSQFLQFEPRSQLAYKRGVFKNLMPKEEYFSQALYTIDIGQNDLSAKSVYLNKTIREYMPQALKLYSEVVKSVYEEGGRYFWIHNTGPLGCLPSILFKLKLQEDEYDSAGCAIRYNELAKIFNKMLNETVVKLREDLPLASFTYVDVYSAKYLLISQAEKYGFEKPLAACCGYGGGKYNCDLDVECGATAKVNGTEVLLGKSCNNPSKRINWDGIHYTEAANKWVFEQIVGGKYSDPPNSLSMACSKKPILQYAK